jgi:hypothetical protein
MSRVGAGSIRAGDSLMQKRRRQGLAAARPVLVAIPVRDEAEEIGPCLLVLAAQRAAQIDAVMLCLNNCHDGTADVVRAIGDHLPFRMHPIEVTLPDGCTGAGCARRIAREHAALVGRGGVLLTPDADARLGPDLDRRQSGRARSGRGRGGGSRGDRAPGTEQG